jgi:electron transfer flavoprotein alpha subunit
MDKEVKPGLPMETILLLANSESDGSLAQAALEALGAAKTLCAGMPGSKLVIGLVGQTVQAGANRIAACGAQAFLGIEGADFTASRYASDAAAAESIAKGAQATVILAPATSRWNRVLPGVAQRLGGRVDTHVTGLSANGGKVSVNRWYYRQRMEAVLQRAQRPWFILIDPGSQPAWQGDSGTATVQAVPMALPESCKRTTVVGVREPATRRPSGRTPICCLSRAPVGPKSRPTANRTSRKRNS